MSDVFCSVLSVVMHECTSARGSAEACAYGVSKPHTTQEVASVCTSPETIPCSSND